MGDDIEGGRRLEGIGAGIGGEPVQHLPEMWRVDIRTNGGVHGAPGIDPQGVEGGDPQQAAPGWRLIIDEGNSRDAVQASGVGQKGEITLSIVGIERRQLGDIRERSGVASRTRPSG